jgi:two-component system, NtrC family, sensor kinase
LNAVQAMAGGGTLRVSVRHLDGTTDGRAKKTVNIQISDTGKGIEKKYLNKVFDPFFTTGDLRKGTGLGLSITHGIIKEHQGAIDVESSPGKGTSVRISLPALG